MSVKAVEIRAAMEQGDFDEALRGALAIWRHTRSSVVADAIDWIFEEYQAEFPGKTARSQAQWMQRAAELDPITVGWLANNFTNGAKTQSDYFGVLSEGYVRKKYAHLIERIEVVADIKDPRIATALCAIVSEGKYTAYGEERAIYRRCSEIIVDIGDRRMLAPLRDLVDNPRAKTQMVRDGLVALLPEFIEALERRQELAPEDEEEWLALVPRRGISDDQKAMLAELHASIMQNPEDLELRHVYADALQEAGDPRGEFIALQLAEKISAKSQKRMRALIREHSKEWLGPYLARAFTSVVYKNGFPDSATLAGNAAMPQEDWRKAYSDERLATLTQIAKGRSNRRHHKAFLSSPAARSIVPGND